MTLSTLTKLTTAALFITTAMLAASSAATPISYRGTERIEAQETAYRGTERIETQETVAFRASGRLNTIAI